MIKKIYSKQDKFSAASTDTVLSELSQEYVEWATGGPIEYREGAISRGGTCQRPDIRVGSKSCDGCEYFKYCLVPGKILKRTGGINN